MGDSLGEQCHGAGQWSEHPADDIIGEKVRTVSDQASHSCRGGRTKKRSVVILNQGESSHDTHRELCGPHAGTRAPALSHRRALRRGPPG